MKVNRELFINAFFCLLVVIIPVLASQFDEPYMIAFSTKIAILAMAGVGLNIALGYGGLISLGHAAFFGIGGYTAGILASHSLNTIPITIGPIEFSGSTEMLVIWATALFMSALVAWAIGVLSLRTSGVYFIMITLAFAQMIYYFAISWPAYGGEDGLSIYIRNNFPGLNTLNPLSFYVISTVLLAAAILLSSMLRNSRYGLILRAARQNEQRLSSVGINPTRVKLVAFIISAMITGLAGALYADLNRFVSPTMFSWHTSGELLVFVILGGVGRLFGPLVGASLYIILEQTLGGVTEHWQFFLGMLLLLVVLFVHGGVIGFLAGKEKT